MDVLIGVVEQFKRDCKEESGVIDCEEILQCLARDLRECILRIYDECVSACRTCKDGRRRNQ